MNWFLTTDACESNFVTVAAMISKLDVCLENSHSFPLEMLGAAEISTHYIQKWSHNDLIFAMLCRTYLSCPQVFVPQMDGWTELTRFWDELWWLKKPVSKQNQSEQIDRCGKKGDNFGFVDQQIQQS